MGVLLDFLRSRKGEKQGVEDEFCRVKGVWGMQYLYRRSYSILLISMEYQWYVGASSYQLGR